jgi:hypothetical protein
MTEDSPLISVDGRAQIVASFELVETCDAVVARLFESLRRTGLSLLSVRGDDRQAYPFEGRRPQFTADSWTATLLCPRDTKDLGWQLQVFVGRAELFLLPDGEIRLRTPGGRPLQKARAV